MTRLTDSPFLTLVISFLTLWACGWIGAKILGRYAGDGPQAREDFRTVLAACLTLLGRCDRHRIRPRRSAPVHGG